MVLLGAMGWLLWGAVLKGAPLSSSNNMACGGRGVMPRWQAWLLAAMHYAVVVSLHTQLILLGGWE